MPWIFDYEPDRAGIAVWLIREDGVRQRRVVPETPAFYVRGVEARHLRRALPMARIESARRRLLGGGELEVWAVRVPPALFARAVARALPAAPRAEFFDADLPVEVLWASSRGLFPLARVRDDLALQDDPWSLDYELPSLRILELREVPGGLEVRVDGSVLTLESQAPRALAEVVRREDPDVIATHGGDGGLVDRLTAVSAGIPWSRGGSPGRSRPARTYFSYGRLWRSAGSRLFSGRWHLDFENSFILRECGLDGLIELARLSRIPVPVLARATVGTAISMMQVDLARREGCSIPRVKAQTEAFKTGLELLRADKGGMTYLPPAGYFERVAELDFASLYPAIMVRHNISPETLGCNCCAGAAPEVGHRFCTLRRGLVPRVLEPILRKRAEYRRRRDAAQGPLRELYDRRQTALKWILVTCFGYLGYRNARFGKIECHEAVTAWSREILLCAKEIAEERGFRLLHAIVDSLWLERPGATEAEFRQLGEEIARMVGIPVTFEGVYAWIGFLPSRMRPGLAVHNRYAGAFGPGKVKCRGIEMRRRDTPPLIARMQERILGILSRARSLAEFDRMVPESLEALREAAARLEEGRVESRDLVIRRRLTVDPAGARGSSWTVLAARCLRARGRRVEAGEEVAFILARRGGGGRPAQVVPLELVGPVWEYDRRAYLAMAVRAAETIVGPRGWDARRLRGWLDLAVPLGAATAAR